MTNDQLARVQGQTAFDNTGQKIGDVQRVFLDRQTNEPTWITVRAGRAGRETVVPLAGSRVGPNGIALAVNKEAITDAPAIDVGSELDMDVVTRLNRHYERSMGAPDTRSETTRPQPERPQPERPSAYAQQGGPAELTSFEEQLRVGTEPVESGSVRLRKVVVTEPVETTVPLRHEEIRVERVPVSEARATPGHQFAEESAEITLHEERPVISKEMEPVESVRVATETRTDQQRVTDQIHRERIEVEDQRLSASRQR